MNLGLECPMKRGISPADDRKRNQIPSTEPTSSELYQGKGTCAKTQQEIGLGKSTLGLILGRLLRAARIAGYQGYSATSEASVDNESIADGTY